LATDQFFSPPTFSTIERISNEPFIDISGADCPDASNWPTFRPASKVEPRQQSALTLALQHEPTSSTNIERISIRRFADGGAGCPDGGQVVFHSH
jgi:hypothetical protein